MCLKAQFAAPRIIAFYAASVRKYDNGFAEICEACVVADSIDRSYC